MKGFHRNIILLRRKSCDTIRSKDVASPTLGLIPKQYVEIFKKADAADMPVTINLAMTPDVTRDHPFFNPESIAIMKQVRKAVKGY